MPSLLNMPSTTPLYTLSLHDALPISTSQRMNRLGPRRPRPPEVLRPAHDGQHDGEPEEADPQPRRVDRGQRDRKSTRLNSSHSQIAYAVLGLNKKALAQEFGLEWKHH